MDEQTKKEQQDILDIYSLRPLTIGDMENISPYLQPLKQEPTQQELENFKNASLMSRVFNHLLSSASLYFYNPYKIDADTAEKEGGFFYKRFFRIPILEDFISPYGFSLAGLTEFLPLVASFGGLGLAAKALGFESRLLSAGEKAISAGIRTAEKIGTTALGTAAKFTASKIPAIENAWLSLNPAVRNIGYSLIKKDLELAPWVAGISYREKQMAKEDPSIIQEYYNAIKNPVNLLFASIGTGLEARAIYKEAKKLGTTDFWKALEDYQKLQDIRLPSIQRNLSELIKKSALENNPINSRFAIDYIETAKKFDSDQYNSLLKLLEKDENGRYIVSRKIRSVLQKEGIAGINNEINKSLSGLDVFMLKTFESPDILTQKLPFYIERLVSDDVLSKKVGESIIKNIGEIKNNFGLIQNNFIRFFDNLIKDDGVKQILTQNEFVAGMLRNNTLDNLSPEQKMSIINMLFKSDAFSNYLKDVPQIQNMFSEIVNNSIILSDKLLKLFSQINNLSESKLSILKKYLLDDIKNELKYNPYAIIPKETQSSVISDNITIPSFFIRDILNSVAEKSKTVITKPELIKTLIREGKLTDFLKDQLDADSFINLASKYPEFLKLTPEEKIQIEKLKNLSEIDSSLNIENKIDIKPQDKPEIIKELEQSRNEVVKNIKETSHIGIQGIEKPRDLKNIEDVKFLVMNPYEELSKNELFLKLDPDVQKAAKDLFAPKNIVSDLNYENYVVKRESFGPIQKFYFVQNVLSGKMLNNPKLYTAKTLINAIDYLTDIGEEKRVKAIKDIVDYYLGKKTKKDIEKTINMALYGSLRNKINFVDGLVGMKIIDQNLIKKDLSNLEDALLSINYQRYADVLLDETNKDFLNKLLPMIFDESDIELILRNDTMKTTNIIIDNLNKGQK
jgi:hypothetical protein